MLSVLTQMARRLVALPLQQSLHLTQLMFLLMPLSLLPRIVPIFLQEPLPSSRRSCHPTQRDYQAVSNVPQCLIHVLGRNNLCNTRKNKVCSTVLTVNPLEINAVSNNSSTARLASELSGDFLHAACK